MYWWLCPLALATCCERRAVNGCAGSRQADAVLLIFTLAAVAPEDMAAMLHTAFQVLIHLWPHLPSTVDSSGQLSSCCTLGACCQGDIGWQSAEPQLALLNATQRVLVDRVKLMRMLCTIP